MFDSGSTPPGASDWVVPGVQRVGSLPASEQLLSEELLVLRAAVDAVVGQDLGGLGDREVLAEVKALLAEVARLEVLGLTRLGVVDRLRLHELDGARSTARWVREQGVAASGAQLALARRLEAFPQLAAGLLAGRRGVPAAQTLGAVLARLRPHVDRPDGLIDGQDAEQVLAGVVVDGVRLVVGQARGGFPAVDDPVLVALLVELPAVLSRPQGELARLEAALLVLAEHVEPGQLAGCLAVLVDALLPGQLEDRARGGHDRRGLRLVARHDGRGWHLAGELDLPCGERLHAFLQAELARDPDNVLDTETAAGLRERGLDPYDRDLADELAPTLRPRSTAERSHDALSNGLARYLDAGLGGSHDKNPVQVAVTVPAGTLDGGPGGLPARGASGSALPLSLVRSWACGSALTRQVLDLRGKVIAISHTERTLTASERRALATQTGRSCQGAGCRRTGRDPGTVLHPHHADPWATSRVTSLADTVQLCDHCHHHVHDGQHPLRLKDGRRLGPHGWTTAQQPPAPP